MNAAFADAVVAQLDNKPDAIVFFHDYHLYLAPRLVRDAHPQALLAQFVHIPWPADLERAAARVARRDPRRPARERRRRLPHRALGAQLPARRCGDARGRRRVTTIAISVDAQEFDELAASDAVLEQEAQIERAGPRS